MHFSFDGSSRALPDARFNTLVLVLLVRTVQATSVYLTQQVQAVFGTPLVDPTQPALCRKSNFGGPKLSLKSL